MTAIPVVVGVDVAKDRLDVAVRSSGEAWSEVNDDGRRWNPALKVFYERLIAAGKPKKVALIACAPVGAGVVSTGDASDDPCTLRQSARSNSAFNVATLDP